MDPIELSLFSSRMEAICEEMGEVLRNAAFSPNIRDRLDYSCAVFDACGELCAQAAHIPVHLGSMAFAMRGIVSARAWHPGDMLILNDPFLGGTHLPDVTLVAPVFLAGDLLGYVVNRAHHADIGAASPGSMPLSSSLAEEGLVIPPTLILERGRLHTAVLSRITEAARNPLESEGDLAAQISANRAGALRLEDLIRTLGPAGFRDALRALNDYGERLSRAALAVIPDGVYRFLDQLDDDGQGNRDLGISVSLTAQAGTLTLDFSGSAPQADGNVNCPLSVTAAAALYVFRCLMPDQTPACAGVFRPITLSAPEGSLLNARPPAAVAAGNVETSMRVTDAVLGALAQALPDRVPAASQGTMNNLAMGAGRAGGAGGAGAAGQGRGWDYYETVGGGAGGGPLQAGASGIQVHMTNTLNTPIEVLETRFPLRVTRYAIRRGSGGVGLHSGGDGLIREFELLAPAEVTLLTERRLHPPWGLAGGGEGMPGNNRLNGTALPPKTHRSLAAGDLLTLESPGGGGWGEIE